MNPKRRIWVAWRGSLLIGALVLGGCVGSRPVQVGTVRVQASGNPDYDDFFRTVLALEEKPRIFQEQRRKARKPLETMLGVGEEVSDTALMDSFRVRILDLRRKGGSFAIEMNGPRLQLVPDQKVPTAPGTDTFVQGVEDSVRAHRQFQTEVSALTAQVDDLWRRKEELTARLADEFAAAGEQKRAHLRQGLEAAGDLLGTIRIRLQRETMVSLSFLAGVEQSITLPPDKVARATATAVARTKAPPKKAAPPSAVASSSGKASGNAIAAVPVATVPVPSETKPAVGARALAQGASPSANDKPAAKVQAAPAPASEKPAAKPKPRVEEEDFSP